MRVMEHIYLRLFDVRKCPGRWEGRVRDGDDIHFRCRLAPTLAEQNTVLRVLRPVEDELVEYCEQLTDCNVLYFFSTLRRLAAGITLSASAAAGEMSRNPVEASGVGWKSPR